MQLVWVTEATYEGGFKLRLTFNDGSLDIAPESLYEQLRLVA